MTEEHTIESEDGLYENALVPSDEAENSYVANVYLDELRERKYHMIILRSKLTEPERDSYLMDIAKSLIKLGHSVTYCIVNSSDDVKRLSPCGPVKISYYNTWMPKSICGAFRSLMDNCRMCWTAIKLVLLPPKPRPKIIFCDINPVVLPILSALGRYPTVLFPTTVLYDDSFVLVPFEPSWFHRRLVQWANEIFIENKCFLEIFDKCYNIRKTARILYPCVDNNLIESLRKPLHVMIPDLPRDALVFAAFGTYEKRTNFKLALRAFQLLLQELERENSSLGSRAFLVIGGDCRVPRHEKFYDQLLGETKLKDYASHVTFLRRTTVTCRKTLLENCVAVIHTKPCDVFSTVILEAMCMGCPVIAPDSGFAQEAVVNKSTGYLLSPSSSSYAVAMYKLITNEVLAQAMGVNAQSTHRNEYGFNVFTKQVEMLIFQMTVDCKALKVK